MTHQVEIEFKTLLTREEYQRESLPSISLIAPPFIPKQIFIFDTLDHQLKQKSLVCGFGRRKIKQNSTLKSPLKEGLLETTDILSLDEAADLRENQKESYLPVRLPIA